MDEDPLPRNSYNFFEELRHIRNIAAMGGMKYGGWKKRWLKNKVVEKYDYKDGRMKLEGLTIIEGWSLTKKTR